MILFSDLLHFKISRLHTHPANGKKLNLSVCVCTSMIHTYVVDRAVVAAQQKEGSCRVTAGDGNHILNLTHTEKGELTVSKVLVISLKLYIVLFIKLTFSHSLTFMMLLRTL